VSAAAHAKTRTGARDVGGPGGRPSPSVGAALGEGEAERAGHRRHRPAALARGERAVAPSIRSAPARLARGGRTGEQPARRARGTKFSTSSSRAASLPNHSSAPSR